MKSGAFVLTTVFLLTVSSVFAETMDEPDFFISTGMQNYTDKPFVTLNYGAAASWLIRIIKQTGRSNFVFRDFLPGLYFSAEMQNIQYVTPAVRVTAYYPLVSSFNYMPQKPNTPLHFAVDFLAGARFEIAWNIFKFNAGPGLHVFFLNADRWNYLNLGVAAAAGVELAINPKWTFLINGFVSVDNGNLGTNRLMEPFDIVYQYQTTVGVRYSKKKLNNSALFMGNSDKPILILER